MKFVFSELFPLIWQKITNRYKSIFIIIYYLYLFISVLRINLLYCSSHVTVINSLWRNSMLSLRIISNICAAAFSSNFQDRLFWIYRMFVARAWSLHETKKGTSWREEEHSLYPKICRLSVEEHVNQI